MFVKFVVEFAKSQPIGVAAIEQLQATVGLMQLSQARTSLCLLVKMPPCSSQQKERPMGPSKAFLVTFEKECAIASRTFEKERADCIEIVPSAALAVKGECRRSRLQPLRQGAAESQLSTRSFIQIK